MKGVPPIIIGIVLLLLGAPVRAARPWGAALNYGGGSLFVHLTNVWSTEVRYLKGSEDDPVVGRVTSQSFGLRLVHAKALGSRWSFYQGGEGALLRSSANRATAHDASGMAAGFFFGLEYALGKRVSIGLDMGPYYINQKSNGWNARESDWRFVGNTAIKFYFVPRAL